MLKKIRDFLKGLFIRVNTKNAKTCLKAELAESVKAASQKPEDQAEISTALAISSTAIVPITALVPIRALVPITTLVVKKNRNEKEKEKERISSKPKSSKESSSVFSFLGHLIVICGLYCFFVFLAPFLFWAIVSGVVYTAPHLYIFCSGMPKNIACLFIIAGVLLFFRRY